MHTYLSAVQAACLWQFNCVPVCTPSVFWKFHNNRMFLNRVLFKVKEPENAIIFTDCTKKHLPGGWCFRMYCVHPFLSAVLPESITHFGLDPIYTIQGWGYEKLKYYKDKLSWVTIHVWSSFTWPLTHPVLFDEPWKLQRTKVPNKIVSLFFAPVNLNYFALFDS